MNDNYRLPEGRNANYFFAFSRRDTGEILLEGYAIGKNKTSAKNDAINQGRAEGIKYYSDGNVKLYMEAFEPNKRTVKDVMSQYGMNMKSLSSRFGIPYRTVQNWCADGTNHRECPEYVIKMMDEILSSK